MRQEKSMLLYAVRITTISLIALCMASAAAAATSGKNKRSPRYSRTAKASIHQISGNRRLQRPRYVKRELRSNPVAVTRHVRRDSDRLRHQRRPEPGYTYRQERRTRFLVADNDRPNHDRDHYRYRDHDHARYRDRDYARYRDHEYDRRDYRYLYRHRFDGYIPLTFHGRQYFYNDGDYYRFTGLGFSLVDDDDIGVYLYSLPFGYRTLYFGGYPYFYVNHHYYIRDHMRHVYVQVDDPDQTVEDNDSNGDSSAYHKLMVYPKKGQSAEQEKQDEYECYLWAVKQVGFDPGMGQPGNLHDYQRAKSACLEGRGYSVN